MRNIIVLSLTIIAFCSFGLAKSSDDINIQQTLEKLDKNPIDKTELPAEDIFEEQIIESPISQDKYDVGQAMLRLSGLKMQNLLCLMVLIIAYYYQKLF